MMIITIKTIHFRLLCVETGRWDNTPLEDRTFTVCKKNDIGDDFHYRFVCDHFIPDRKSLLVLIITKTQT